MMVVGEAWSLRNNSRDVDSFVTRTKARDTDSDQQRCMCSLRDTETDGL